MNPQILVIKINLKNFIQVHLVYYAKNQYFINFNRKKGKKRELNFIEQHNIIVLSKNVKQSSQSKLADWLFSVAFFEI